MVDMVLALRPVDSAHALVNLVIALVGVEPFRADVLFDDVRGVVDFLDNFR